MVCFADALVTRKSKGTHKLERIHALVRWNRVSYRLKKILNRSGLGPTGYEPLQLFKALLLQNLYGLSDPQMEEMLYDRISFRDFCGIGMSGEIPDETTLCRFRAALKGKTEGLFKLVLQDIESQGILIKSGTIVDATVITSGVTPPRGGEVSEKDPEAGWTKKGGKYVYGYKAHTACDKETGIITSIIATSADVHDSQVFEQLLTGQESLVMADKAYDSDKRRKLLMKHGIEDQIMYKKKKGKQQPRWQLELNKLWSKKRGRIESIFGIMKECMGLRRARYKGWDKQQVHFDLFAMAYNLKRTLSIL